MNSSYWTIIWQQFRKNKIGCAAFILFCLFVIVGVYAPFFASSKPIFLTYQGQWYFPLFRYLFYNGFYTKGLDLFYNILMFTLPLALLALYIFKGRYLLGSLIFIALLQIGIFIFLLLGFVKDPASNFQLLAAREKALSRQISPQEDRLLGSFSNLPDWGFDLQFMNPYDRLNLLLRYRERKEQNEKLRPYAEKYLKSTGKPMPTLFEVDQKNNNDEKQRLQKFLETLQPKYESAVKEYPEIVQKYRPLAAELTLAQKRNQKEKSIKSKDALDDAEKKILPLTEELKQTRDTIQDFRTATAKLHYLEERQAWLEKENSEIKCVVMPLIRPFHWQDDAGGEQKINHYVPWWELSRINRKDLTAALIFGIRISLVVGITAVALALIIGLPVGTVAGYFAGKSDILICRLIEIWEAMPVFFMLLLIVAITQSKSIFLVIATIGIFGWTSFSRFIRGEVLKQRNLSYVYACHNLGFGHPRIMFSHILPNAIPPILTLLPFAMMSAITSEAALSFLGLGEEGSCSWGVLMDEGRSVFPGESYLLWPPAILLTLLLISIALVGDALRDAIDPKLRV